MSDLQEFIRDTKELRTKVHALEAENAALKAALRNIIDNWESGELIIYWVDETEHRGENFDSARALLEEKP